MRTLHAWALSAVTVLLAAIGVVATPIAAHADIVCSVSYAPVWDFYGAYTGANNPPTIFTLNNVPCSRPGRCSRAR